MGRTKYLETHPIAKAPLVRFALFEHDDDEDSSPVLFSEDEDSLIFFSELLILYEIEHFDETITL